MWNSRKAGKHIRTSASCTTEGNPLSAPPTAPAPTRYRSNHPLGSGPTAGLGSPNSGRNQTGVENGSNKVEDVSWHSTRKLEMTCIAGLGLRAAGTDGSNVATTYLRIFDM
ncbi:hypothetical protein LA080_005787 [Diaporthe eres]|nr:hypothetical protein LA080_005787 [Diaporthe eres]